MGCGASAQQQEVHALHVKVPHSVNGMSDDLTASKEQAFQVKDIEPPDTATQPDLAARKREGSKMSLASEASVKRELVESVSKEAWTTSDVIDQLPPSMQVTDYICQCLVDCGVTHVFGGHGGAVVPLIDSIVKHPKLTWVYMRCELNASLTAAAYAKLRQGLGVCVGTSGPGASHLLTGLMDAQMDQCPVLCLTGMKNLEKIGLGEFQDIGQTEIFKTADLSVSNTLVHKSSVVPLLRSAISSCLQTYTCSHLAIPFDIQQMTIEVPDLVDSTKDFVDHAAKRPSEQDLQDTAEFIKGLRQEGAKCLIVVGCRAYRAHQSITRLAEIMGVPLLSTLHGKGIVSDRHPNNVGVVGIFGNLGMEASAELVRTADCIIAIGQSMLTDNLVMSAYGIQQRELVVIDVNSSVLDMRCQAEFTLFGDIEIVCNELAAKLDILSIPTPTGRRLSMVPFSAETTARRGSIRKGSKQRTNTLTALGGLSWGKKEDVAKFGFKVNSLHLRPITYEPPDDELTGGFCHPGLVLQMLGPKLNKGAVICVDVGDVTLWVSLCLTLDQPDQRTLASMRMGTMGYSVDSAIAAWTLRGKESHIVAVAGDGGVQMSINELGTLQQLGAKVLLIIFVNNKLGRVANEVWGGPGAPPPGGCDITVPDFCKVAEAYGGKGLRISTSDVKEISSVLDEALAHPGVCILEVAQDPQVCPFMAKNSTKVPKAAKANNPVSVQVLNVEEIQGP